MNHQIPDYLVEKKNIISMLIFTAFFSLIFINIYRPFGSKSWVEITQTIFFISSSIIVFSAIIILSVSRFIMYKVVQKSALNYWQFFMWIIIEIAVIALLYSFLTKFAFNNKDDFMMIFLSAFLYSSLVLFLPYALSWLYFALRNSEKVISRITKEENFIDLGNEKNELINFTDEKDVLRLSIKISNLLYIESADNYIVIYYLNKGKPSKFLLRNSLKKIEEMYSSKMLLRCHRSYIVNLQKIKILRKDKEGIFLELDIEDLPDIPVSKTYSEKVVQSFSSNSF